MKFPVYFIFAAFFPLFAHSQNCNGLNVSLVISDTMICPGAATTLNVQTITGLGTYYDTINLYSYYNASWDSGNFATIPTPFKASPGLDTLGGIPFLTGCNTCDNNWAAVNVPGPNPIILAIPVFQKNIDSVYALINTWWGTYGGPYAAIELISGGQIVLQKNLFGGGDIRDYNQNIYTNYINGTSTINVYLDTALNRRLDMVQLAVPVALYDTVIDSILFVDNGSNGVQRLAVSGLTLEITDTGAVSYLWSNGDTGATINASPRQTSVYTVTVATGDGCTASASGTVHVYPADMLLISTPDSAFCTGDSTPVCATAGFATYNWGNTYTTQCIEAKYPGNYNVIATDTNGCTAQSNQILLTTLQSPSAIITANATSICASDSAQICASPGFISYVWNNNNGADTCIEAKNAGDYYVTVTDNSGCTAESNHIGITAYQTPQVSISVSRDTLKVYNAVSAQWYLNNNPISGATQSTYIADSSGSYSVSVTDTNGCNSFSTAIVYTGITALSVDGAISIYPNPLPGGNWQLAVGSNVIGAHIEILDDNGSIVYQSEIRSFHSEIDASFADGVYLLRITSGSDVVVKKLVKL